MVNLFANIIFGLLFSVNLLYAQVSISNFSIEELKKTCSNFSFYTGDFKCHEYGIENGDTSYSVFNRGFTLTQNGSSKIISVLTIDSSEGAKVSLVYADGILRVLNPRKLLTVTDEKIIDPYLTPDYVDFPQKVLNNLNILTTPEFEFKELISNGLNQIEASRKKNTIDFIKSENFIITLDRNNFPIYLSHTVVFSDNRIQFGETIITNYVLR